MGILEILTEFVKAQPLLSIALFSLLATLISVFSYKWFTPQERMKEIREKVKECQKKIKEEKDLQKQTELQKEMMPLSMEQMKLTMKPTLITMIPFILILTGLRSLYLGAGIGNIIYWKVNLPLVGDGAGWLLSYVIFSIIFSMILRKYLKIY